MSDAVIQKSLIDIEQNLRKLDSARNQVGIITDKSSELISSISSVLESINAIQQSFESDENYLINNVNVSLNAFSEKLDNGAANANKKTAEITSSHEKAIDTSIEKIKEFQNNLREVQQSILDFDVEQSLTNIDETLGSMTERINSYQDANSEDLNVIKSELETLKNRHIKTTKINIFSIVVGFLIVVALIIVTN